jgi:predicted enzyme related to lactoylglutathione lyase
MPNQYVQGVELHANEPNAAKAFYQALFGWRFEDIPEMGYSKFADPGASGGIMRNPVVNSPSRWAPYFLVGDVAAAVETASNLGATVVIPTTEIAGHGWFAVMTDPDGATFGLWKSEPGLDRLATPSRPRDRPVS